MVCNVLKVIIVNLCEQYLQHWLSTELVHLTNVRNVEYDSRNVVAPLPLSLFPIYLKDFKCGLF